MTVFWKLVLVLVALTSTVSGAAVATVAPDWGRSAHHRSSSPQRDTNPVVGPPQARHGSTTSTTASDAPPSAPAAAMAAYKEFVTARANDLVNETGALDAAVRSNDLATAKSSYI